MIARFPLHSQLPSLFSWVLWGCFALTMPNGGWSALVRSDLTSSGFPASPLFPGYQLTTAFGDLRFEAPVAIATPPGETNRLFVVERAGVVQVITNLAAPNKTVFLDLASRTASHNIESGVLGLAFHPGFATNGFVFTFRTSFIDPIGYANLVSRFRVSTTNANVADLDSETIILAVADPSDEHNAGDIHFGPEGYLYVAMGDRGPFVVAQANLQPIDDSLNAGILRLDVDGRPGSLAPNPLTGATLNYRVPPDNPFVGASAYQGSLIQVGKLRTEFFAVGFRNPWRMSFDPLTGRLFCGDVGSSEREEVNLVVRGGNYGWPYYEGSIPVTDVPSSVPTNFVFTLPLAEYGRGNGDDQGNAIVGGLVYRGERIPQLAGKYLFADNVKGHVWCLDYESSSTNGDFVRITGEAGISSFGVDPRDQEVLLANHSSGAILKLIYVPQAQSNFPLTLAETGVFKDLETLSPNSGVVPYDINLPFWSDFAIKTRWFGLTAPDTFIQYAPTGNWAFPLGAFWIKHFEMEMTNGVAASRRRLETRFLVKNAQGVYGGTYKWDAAQTNAVLVPDQGLEETIVIRDGTTSRSQVWRYPSRGECRACHTEAGGYALGFHSTQLNRIHDYDGDRANQITALSQAGYLSRPVVDDLQSQPVLATANDTDYPLEYRVRSYLAANCVQCHQPGSLSTLDVFWDARFETPLGATRLLGSYVHPGDLTNSILLQKISFLSTIMPPIGTAVLNTNAISLVSEWISALPQPPWRSADVGSVSLPGSTLIQGGRFSVSGSGRDIWQKRDEFQFIHQPLSNNLRLKARFVSQKGSSPFTKVGLMVRQNTDADASHAMLARLGDGTFSFQQRVTPGTNAESVSMAGTTASQWMSLVREGNRFRGLISNDGTQWTEVGQEVVPMSSDVLVGLASCSRDPSEHNTAVFDSVQLIAAEWALPQDQETFDLPARLPLQVNVTAGREWVSQVLFLDGTNVIGQSSGPVFQSLWTNRLAGDVSVVARVRDKTGAEFDTTPRLLHFRGSPSAAQVLRVDWSTRGKWTNSYGHEGAMVVGDSTNLPSSLKFDVSQVFPLVWQPSSTDSRALSRQSKPGAVAAAWVAPSSIEIDLFFRDNGWHQVLFYCVDFDSAGRRERVELRDSASDQLLVSQDLPAFQTGVFVGWVVRGHVRARLIAANPLGAALSGVFIDGSPNKPPTVQIVRPSTGQSLILPSDVVIEARTSDADGTVEKMEFFANNTKIGEMSQAPFLWSWPNPLSGDYEIFVRVTDNFGEIGESLPVRLVLTTPKASASFVTMDTTTQGAWRGNYGRDGYQVAAAEALLPAYLKSFGPSTRTFIWDEPTSDPRAVQHVTGDMGIASCWVDVQSVVNNWVFADGRKHLLSVYFLDWDSVSRKIDIDLYDDASSRLLDSQSLSDFHGGVYLSWVVQGRVRLETVSRLNDAVNSAVFFDPEAVAGPRIRSAEVRRVSDRFQVKLVWLSLPGSHYKVQVSPTMGEGWTDLSGALVADGSEFSQSFDVAANQPRLFFRIVRIP